MERECEHLPPNPTKSTGFSHTSRLSHVCLPRLPNFYVSFNIQLKNCLLCEVLKARGISSPWSASLTATALRAAYQSLFPAVINLYHNYLHSWVHCVCIYCAVVRAMLSAPLCLPDTGNRAWQTEAAQSRFVKWNCFLCVSFTDMINCCFQCDRFSFCLWKLSEWVSNDQIFFKGRKIFVTEF